MSPLRCLLCNEFPIRFLVAALVASGTIARATPSFACDVVEPDKASATVLAKENRTAPSAALLGEHAQFISAGNHSLKLKLVGVPTEGSVGLTEEDANRVAVGDEVWVWYHYNPLIPVVDIYAIQLP